jgi:polar amino acid transport system permease protein
VSEVFRAGIESVHESQRAGARSLGLSTWQTNVHVVMPQAVRRVVPPLMNDFISLQKDVALVSLLGPVEALRRADVIQDRTFNFTPFVVAALLFIAVSLPLIRLADHLMAKERRRMSGTAVR